MTFGAHFQRFIAGASSYVKNAVTFDGSTTAVLRNGSAIDSNKKTFTMSAYFYKTDGGSGVENIFTTGTSGGINRLTVRFSNGLASGGVQIQGSSSVTGVLTASFDLISGSHLDQWVHLAISIDLSSTSKRKVFVNGSQIADGDILWSTYSNTNMDFSACTNFCVGAAPDAGGQFFTGDMGDFYFDTAYTDLSSTIGNFYSATMKKPPSGGKVTLYGATDTWHENKGTLTGFTEVGTLSTSTNLPVSI